MKEGGSGWTSPPVILTIASLIMTSLASYIALRDDATEATQSIRDRLTVIETSLRERREYQDQQTRQIMERVERIERGEHR